MQLWDTLEKDPLFAHQDVDLTLDQKRELTHRRTKRLCEYDFLPRSEAVVSPAKYYAFVRAIQMYDMALSACHNLSRIVSTRCTWTHPESIRILLGECIYICWLMCSYADGFQCHQS